MMYCLMPPVASTFLPVLLLPVRLITLTLSSATSLSLSAPGTVRTAKDSRGNPASSTRRAKRMMGTGSAEGGFTTTALPATAL